MCSFKRVWLRLEVFIVPKARCSSPLPFQKPSPLPAPQLERGLLSKASSSSFSLWGFDPRARRGLAERTSLLRRLQYLPLADYIPEVSLLRLWLPAYN